MFPDWESNRWPFGFQAGAQSTEPHLPGHYILFIDTKAGGIRKFTCGRLSIKDPILDLEINDMVPNPTGKEKEAYREL